MLGIKISTNNIDLDALNFENIAFNEEEISKIKNYI